MMHPKPVSARDLRSYCHRISDLTRLTVRHVDRVLDRANDNDANCTPNMRA